MMIAHVNGERRLAEKLAHKRLDCRCPGCALPVLARVGEQRAPHWAHVRKSDCPVAAGETDWHREWKSLGQPHEIEVVRPEWPGHRADLCLVEQGHLQVIELQHSGIALETIRQRELAYRDVVWIVDVSARAFTTSGDRFQWKRASIVWSEAEQVIFDDGKAVHGRLAGAAEVPRIGEQLLFNVQTVSGRIASWPRPADRVSLVALLAAFKSVRRDYLAAREAEHQVWAEQERQEQERRAAARRDSWFRPSPGPTRRPLTEEEQIRADLRRVSAALEAMQAETTPTPKPSIAELDHEVLFGDWPRRDSPDKPRS